MRAPLGTVPTRILMLTPPIAYCAFLWWLSSIPKLTPPGGNDKLAHVLAYALLGALAARGVWFTTSWPILKVGGAAFAWAALYGCIDELHQSFVPGRDASWGDVAADVAGGFLGTAVTLIVFGSIVGIARRAGGFPPRGEP